MERKIGIISKDAGSANQIAWYVKNYPSNYLFALEEPAINIFESVLGPITNYGLEDLFLLSDELISGTGWQSDFEWAGIQRFVASSKKVTTYLDNWNDYSERFIREGVKVLPDVLWVSDLKAERKATLEFPNIPIVLQKNYYIESIRERRADFRRSLTKENGQSNVLYLTEPILEVESHNSISKNFSEFDALKLFLDEYELCDDLRLNLRIRFHPSEKQEKYAHMISDIERVKSDSIELAVDLAWADYVIGVDTYAMYVANQLDLPVATSATEIDFQGSIPWEDIVSLKKVGLRNFLSKE
jgi:hypothetical protein